MIILQNSQVSQVLNIAFEGNAILRANEVDALPYSFVIDSVGEKLVLKKLDPSQAFMLSDHVELRFRLASIPFAFEATLEKGSEADTMLCDLPTLIESRDRREQLRVTFPKSLNVSGQVTCGTNTTPVEVIDASHIGVQVKALDSSLCATVSGSPCTLSLQYRDESVSMTGIVMWKVRDTLGILLPDMRRVAPEEEYHPWVKLLHIAVIDSVITTYALHGAASEALSSTSESPTRV